MNEQENNMMENQENIPSKEMKKFAAYGGFWRRMASAQILDYAVASVLYLLLVIYGIFNINFMFALTDEIVLFSEYTGIAFLLYGTVLVHIVANIVLYFKDGQTLGYKILAMKLVDAKTGEKPTGGKLFLRFFIKLVFTILSIITLGIFALVWMIMLAVNNKKQGLHDKVANTLVVRENMQWTWLVWVCNLYPLVIVVIMIASILSVIF